MIMEWNDPWNHGFLFQGIVGIKATRKIFQKELFLKKCHFILQDHYKERSSFNIPKDC